MIDKIIVVISFLNFIAPVAIEILVAFSIDILMADAGSLGKWDSLLGLAMTHALD